MYQRRTCEATCKIRLTARTNSGIDAAVMRTLVAVGLVLATGCDVAGARRTPPPRDYVVAARAPTKKEAAARHGSSRAKASGRATASRDDAARSTTSRGGCPADVGAAVVAQVNAERAAVHLQPLVADPKLTRAAESRARSMAASSRLSHAGWESTIRGELAVASTMGENVAYDYPTASAVVDGWMRSSGHRRNILNGSFRRIGVGCVADARAHLWWAQDFAD
jgi:uncharacterized protein YkwD